MVDELDPERLHLRETLRDQLLPWIVAKAFETREVVLGISKSKLDPNALADEASMADHLVTSTGPQFDAVYRLALGRDGRIDNRRLRRELDKRVLPIRWGLFYEAPGVRSTEPMSLHEALSNWCTVVLRDTVLPELRRLINANLPGTFSTVLAIGATPGLRQPHDVSFTVVTRSARRFLAAIARTHGNGAIGLAGPRGSGKTTLIERYVSGLPGSLRTAAPVAVAVSCPVHYDARDFVLHLHATLCRAVINRIEDRAGDRPRRRRNLAAMLRLVAAQLTALLLASATAAAALYPVVRPNFARPLLHQALHPTGQVSTWMLPLLIVAGFGMTTAGRAVLELLRTVLSWTVAALLTIPRGLFIRPSEFSFAARRSDSGEDELKRSARDWQRQIRLLQTSTTGWSGTLALPWGVGGSAVRSIQLAERPLTYPEVVASLREFIVECVEVLGPMVIAIDELDKISSAEKAQSFVNDIKGVFGVPGCLYLVSVSEDALVTFERSALGVRDAFDSAFDEIVPIEYLHLADSLELLRSRAIGISEPFGYLCHCLSGGLPRELVRVLRRIAEYRHNRQTNTLSSICGELVADDLAAKARELRILANRQSPSPDCIAFANSIVRLPQLASAKELVNLTTSLVRQRGAISTNPTIDRLRWEAAMLAYHSATLREVFNDQLDEVLAVHARDDITSPGSFDQLSRARNAVTEDPHLAWLLLDDFREAWNLPIVPGR